MVAHRGQSGLDRPRALCPPRARFHA
jgi:hypothetical protein